MLNEVHNFGSVSMDDKIYVFGGTIKNIGSGYLYTSSIEMYDPDANKWNLQGYLSSDRSIMGTSIIGNSVYVYGGYNGVALNTVEQTIIELNAPVLSAAGSDRKVILNWTSVNDAQFYKVYRSTTTGGPYKSIATTTAGAIVFSDSGIENGKTYYYVVSAVNAGGESLNSNEASATIPLLVNKLKLVLEVKEEKQLSVTAELSDNAQMDWTSSDSTITTVDVNGKIKALKPGNTVITCISKDKSYTEAINVLVVDLEYQLAVDLNIGDICRLTTTNVTWSSYDPTIATVSDKGKVTGSK